MAKKDLNHKQKPVKIEGTDIRKCSDSYLSSKLGTYKACITVSRVIGAGIFLFLLIFGATYDWKLMLAAGGGGLVLGALFCLLSLPLVSKVKAISNELDRRAGKNTAKKEEVREHARRSGNRYKAIAAAAVVAGLLLALICLVLINGNKKKDGCTICGEKVTQTFQGSDYCEMHYAEAIKWAFENVAEKDD